MIEQAQEIVRKHVVYSLGAGLIPIPMLDVAAVTAIQLDMMRQLSKLYETDFSDSQGKAWVAALTGSSLARLAAGFVKVVPGIGSILGGVTMSALSGASTYAVGQVAITYLSEDQNPLDVDIEEAREIFEEAFEKGKKVAEDLAKEKASSKTAEEDVFKTLEKLGKLRDSGVISAEEFEAKKKELLERI